MKLGLLADLHFRGRDLADKSRALRSALRDMRSRGVEWVLDAGDTFDSPRVLDRHAATGTIYRAFLDPVEEAAIPWLILDGNHTMAGPRDQGALAVLVRKNRDLIQVVTRPEVVTRHGGLSGPGAGVAVGCLPWGSKAHWLAQPGVQDLSPEEQAQRWQSMGLAVLQGLRRELAQEAGFKVLLGHVEVAGSVNSYRFILPGSTFQFAQTDLDAVGADLVALGHYHRRQGYYLGAFTQLNHGEEGNPCGWLYVDTATGEREFIDVAAPRYFTVRSEDYRRENYEAWDRVKIIGTEPPAGELPANAVFEAEVAAQSAAVREGAEGLDPGAPLHVLLSAWLQAQGQEDVDLAPLMPLVDAVERDAGATLEAVASGSLTRILSVRVTGLGPHVDTQADFSQGDWWAIMGRNGAGKTFLLEAPIACLYGGWAHPYRGTSLYDAMPGTEARIEVVFQAEGSTWRASRRLRKTAKSQACEALLTRVEAAREVPVAGPKVRDFEQAVERLVGPLSLVLGSIFLSQKAEGDLVSADTAARKEFMRRFLRLDRFDPLAEAAKHRALGIEAQLAGRELQLDELPRLREARPALEEAVAAAETTVRAREEAIAPIEVDIASIIEEGQRLRSIQDARASLVRAHAEAAHAVVTTSQEAVALEARVVAQEAALARGPELRAQADQLPGVRARLQQVATERATYQAALRARLEAERLRDGLAQEVVALEARAVTQETSLNREPGLRAQVAEMPAIQARLEALRGQATRRAEALAERARLDAEVQRHQADLRQAGADLRRELQQADQQIASIQEEIARCQSRGSLLSTAGCASQGFLPCPLIDGARQDLARVADLQAKVLELEATRDALGATLLSEEFAHDTRAALAIATAARDAVEVPDSPDPAETTTLEARIVELQTLDRTLATLDQVRQHLAQTQADLAAKRGALADAETALAGTLVPSPPDAAEEVSLRQLEETLAAAERELARLDQVRETLTQTRGDLAARREALGAAERRLEEASQAVAEAQDVGAALEAMRALHGTRKADLEVARKALGEAQVALGQARQAVAESDRRIADLVALEASLAALRTERDGYRRIQAACGKDGIPQLLISAAIPAIEDIVQEVCRVDFGGAFRLRFDTVKTLKSGESRESFDILFSRPGAPEYDARSCSGGEEAAVRAAIRVALVLYQAQRASGSYRVCWLDEPAAHQDQENAEATLRMLDRLRDRFAQAFVVSHDDELLAGFQHRVELVPGPGGTRVAGVEAPAVIEVAA